MKYLGSLSLLLLLPLLTSCKLRLGDNLYDVPWWVILMAVGVVLLIILVPALQNIQRIWFTCPGCGQRFKPAAAKLLFSLHANHHRVLKCPLCGKRSMCAPSYDQDGD